MIASLAVAMVAPTYLKLGRENSFKAKKHFFKENSFKRKIIFFLEIIDFRCKLRSQAWRM